MRRAFHLRAPVLPRIAAGSNGDIAAKSMATSSVTKFTRPATIVVICLYAAAATTPDADRVRDHLFSGVSAYLDTLPKSAHVFVCGDYNALLRKGDVDCLFSRNPISRHPVARNAREELIDFCGANQLSVANGR